jgi:polysaccharide export outer membrane protein
MSHALIRTLCLLASLFTLPVTAQEKTPPQDYTLGAGDIIRVQVFQNPELTIDTRVSENGSITYPLIESVLLGGLSIGEAERKIGQALKEGGYVRKPQVNIVLVQVRGNQISVLGQVNRPGRFPLETFNTRVSDMLAAAGGTSSIGDDVAILTGRRNGLPFRQKIDIPALYLDDSKEVDSILVGGDSIYVHRAPIFYIYGEAQRSGSYRIERGMTVMQALAQSGGPTARGSEYRLRLHRRNAAGLIEKTAPEMSELIQPNDVLYVRESIF